VHFKASKGKNKPNPKARNRKNKKITAEVKELYKQSMK
jgi:hypothetical protein